MLIVFDSIFYQHLQGGRWQLSLCLSHLVGNTDLNALTEPLLEQGKIAVEKLQFFLQRHHLVVKVRQCVAIHLREVHQICRCPLRVNLYQIGQNAEIIEYEVRTQLVFQCLQAELISFPFSLLARLPVIERYHRRKQAASGIVHQHLPRLPRPTVLKLLTEVIVGQHP